MNYRAARRGRSRADFVAKLGTVYEEADECAEWLRHMQDAEIRQDPALLQEGEELASIFAASIKTARRNDRRRRGLPPEGASAPD